MPLDRHATTLPPVVLRAVPGADHVLTPEALGFVAALQARFGLRLHALMVAGERALKAGGHANTMNQFAAE